jgi:WD40 repeat protein
VTSKPLFPFAVAFLLMIPQAPAAPVSFSRDIAPILLANCQTCHGPDKAKGKYRLHTFEQLLKPGDSEHPPIVPGNPSRSELFRRLIAADPDDRMPQKADPLPREQIALIERWIKEGAHFDGPDAKATLEFYAARAAHPPAPKNYPRPVPVVALAFSPDGSELAAGGYHEVTFWNPADGALVGRIGNLPQRTQSLAYSPDGRVLAAASGTPGRTGEINLLDPAKRTIARNLDRISDMVFAVAFSPDGSRLAAGGADNSIRIYDPASAKRLLLIEQHADWVTAVAFSPDGARLASASRDKSARVFDAATGQMLSAYLGHEQPLLAIVWTGDKSLCTAGQDRQIHFWNTAETSKKIGDLPAPADVLRMVRTTDSLFIASADGAVRQYSLKDHDLTRTYPGQSDWAYSLAVHEKTHRLATAGFDGAVRLYDTETGKPVASFIAAPGYGKVATRH